jgi:hypothetical protein
MYVPNTNGLTKTDFVELSIPGSNKGTYTTIKTTIEAVEFDDEDLVTKILLKQVNNTVSEFSLDYKERDFRTDIAEFDIVFTCVPIKPCNKTNLQFISILEVLLTVVEDGINYELDALISSYTFDSILLRHKDLHSYEPNDVVFSTIYGEHSVLWTRQPPDYKYKRHFDAKKALIKSVKTKIKNVFIKTSYSTTNGVITVKHPVDSKHTKTEIYKKENGVTYLFSTIDKELLLQYLADFLLNSRQLKNE